LTASNGRKASQLKWLNHRLKDSKSSFENKIFFLKILKSDPEQFYNNPSDNLNRKSFFTDMHPDRCRLKDNKQWQ